ncbi:MAG: NAD-dependent epimerase/dehydratase family protein [Pseudomonadota bacterium]|nr:NAD-dependent epimerase/dehydratase family protein [Pseudomonadota bacterium]
MQKVLVTGGAGFIGSHTVEALLTSGVAVRVLDDLSCGRRENLPSAHPRLEFIEGDIRDVDAVKAAMQDVSHCLHLAAQVSVTRSLEYPRASAERNVLGFVTVLESARAAGVERFVYASSAAVYGDPETLPLTEAAGLKPLSPYGLEKLINERYADLYERVHGLPSMGLRYFNVFGPRQDPTSPYAGVIALFIERVRSGRALRVFGDGLQTRDFIFVGDVARANIAALDAEATGVCNVATGCSMSLLELIEAVGQVYGAQPDIEFLPPRDGDIKQSAADTSRMHKLLGVDARIELLDGLRTLLPDGAFSRR